MKRNYRVVHADDKQVVVAAKYRGKSVRAVAKCNPNDTFDLAFGERLATLRCKEKVAAKKAKDILKAYCDICREENAIRKKRAQLGDKAVIARAALAGIRIEMAELLNYE